MTTTTLADLVGANVKRLREAHGWSQTDLAARARAAGLTRWTGAQVSKVETGRYHADRILDCAVLCEIFGIALTDLLAGDATVAANGGSKPLLDVRLALVGEAETDPDLSIADEYNLDRIAQQAGLQHQGELRAICYALFDRENFLELRDERAGIAIRPGTRANISARRGNATKALISKIAAAVAIQGLPALLEQAQAKRRDRAVDIDAEGEQ